MNKEKVLVLLGLGSNQGNRLEYLEKAIHEISKIDSLQIIQASSVYISQAIGPKQRDFYNLVIAVETRQKAEKLLTELQSIEKKLGRIKKTKWGPRTIDIDILIYGKEIIKTERLTIPHKEIYRRKFVILPLLELSKDLKLSDLRKIETSMEIVKNQRVSKIIDSEKIKKWIS